MNLTINLFFLTGLAVALSTPIAGWFRMSQVLFERGPVFGLLLILLSWGLHALKDHIRNPRLLATREIDYSHLIPMALLLMMVIGWMIGAPAFWQYYRLTP